MFLFLWDRFRFLHTTFISIFIPRTFQRLHTTTSFHTCLLYLFIELSILIFCICVSPVSYLSWTLLLADLHVYTYCMRVIPGDQLKVNHQHILHCLRINALPYYEHIQTFLRNELTLFPLLIIWKKMYLFEEIYVRHWHRHSTFL